MVERWNGKVQKKESSKIEWREGKKEKDLPS